MPPRFHPDWSGVSETHSEYHEEYYSSAPDTSSIPDQI